MNQMKQSYFSKLLFQNEMKDRGYNADKAVRRLIVTSYSQPDRETPHTLPHIASRNISFVPDHNNPETWGFAPHTVLTGIPGPKSPYSPARLAGKTRLTWHIFERPTPKPALVNPTAWAYVG